MEIKHIINKNLRKDVGDKIYIKYLERVIKLLVENNLEQTKFYEAVMGR